MPGAHAGETAQLSSRGFRAGRPMTRLRTGRTLFLK